MKRIIALLLTLSLVISSFTMVHASVDVSEYKVLMTLSIKMGEVGHIGMTDSNNNPISVTWTSSDMSIATVDAAGKVTP